MSIIIVTWNPGFSVLNSKVVYRGCVFEVRQEQIELPDGSSAQMDILAHSGAVVVLPIDDADQVWFIRQYRHAIGDVLLELPAGGLEAGESPEACAHRELREEIGMAARSLVPLGGFYLAPGYSSEYLHIFLARDMYSAPLSGDVDEFIQVEQMPLANFKALALSGEIVDSKTLSALFLAEPHLT